MARADALDSMGLDFAVHGGSAGGCIADATSAAIATPDTYYDLGIRYAVGRGVPVDLVTAHKWFNLAALNGNTAARERRAEIARDMTRSEIALAQKQAREHLARR